MGIDNLNNNFQEKSNLSFNDSFNQDKKQSKKPIIISVIVLIIVIGLVIIFYPSSEDKAEDEDKASSVIVQEAGTSDDVIHEGSEDESQEAVTVFEYSDKEIKEIDECVQNLIDLGYLALLEDDVSNCEKSDEPIECSDFYFRMKSISNNDAALCEKSSTSDNALACKGMIAKDPSICMKFGLIYEQGFCNSYVNNDPSICKQLSNGEDILTCEEDFYLARVLTSKNKDDCFEFDQEYFQVFCTNLISGNGQTFVEGLRSLCVTSD
jgi:hypothetical protein|tara:strand:+ start:30604 stop:31401 length:798 start_codon:yes stop_codon:yes gene_type:complete